MFKINRKKIISLVSGIALATSLGLYGCDSKESNNSENTKIEFVDSEDTYMTAVYYDGNISIIIPIYKYDSHDSGFVTLSTRSSHNPVFSISDITVFYNLDNLSFYDQALRFAEAISDEVYLYSDVINGSPVNLVTDDSNTKDIKVK